MSHFLSLELDFELKLELALGENNRHHSQTAVGWFMDCCFEGEARAAEAAATTQATGATGAKGAAIGAPEAMVATETTGAMRAAT